MHTHISCVVVKKGIITAIIKGKEIVREKYFQPGSIQASERGLTQLNLQEYMHTHISCVVVKKGIITAIIKRKEIVREIFPTRQYPQPVKEA